MLWLPKLLLRPTPKCILLHLGRPILLRMAMGPVRENPKALLLLVLHISRNRAMAKGNFISNRKIKKHLLAMSRSKNAAKAFDQFSTFVEHQHNRVKRMASAKKKQKAKGQDASSSNDYDEVSVHVMSPAEVTKVRLDSMRKELQTTLVCNKRTICFDPKEDNWRKRQLSKSIARTLMLRNQTPTVDICRWIVYIVLR